MKRIEKKNKNFLKKKKVMIIDQEKQIVFALVCLLLSRRPKIKERKCTFIVEAKRSA